MEIDKFEKNKQYAEWLAGLKHKVQQHQIKAVIKVNTAMLEFYWELGSDIVEKQNTFKWGDGLFQQLSNDLKKEFPDMNGFSVTNLRYIRQWYLFYSQCLLIHQQAVGELTMASIVQIPWGHNIAIISKCKNAEEAAFYIHKTVEHNWSRSVLVHQIESGLHSREGKAITNFSTTLAKPQSDLAQQTLKDPFIFDFLTLRNEFDEKELEKGLIEHITQFLLELGAGFAYIGRQFPVHVGNRDFYIDLLLYHTRLHCYVVVELKTVDFEPEHTGKLNFYIKAIDEQLRKKGDEPTIGILLCKSKDKLIAEYALSDINKPIGVSEYQLTQSLPEDLKSSLPSIEEIEKELAGKK